MAVECSSKLLSRHRHLCRGRRRFTTPETGWVLFGPRRVFGYCRKGFFSALPGAQQLLGHAWTESEASPPPCPGSYLYPFSPAHGFFFYIATYPGQQKLSTQWTGLSVGPSAARIETYRDIPRARDVEIKALLTQRRVLKGRLVYPLPHRGLKECTAAMGFNWALGGASNGP